jgi:integrase/recombinase XerD
MKIQATAIAGIILETRQPRKDGVFPVKLRITNERQRKYYVLKDAAGKSMAYSEKDFSTIITSERPRGSFKETKIFLSEIEKRAGDIIEALPSFTFERFERKFFGADSNEQDLFSCLRSKESSLRKEGRISTAVTFLSTVNSLVKFSGRTELNFKNIDSTFLKEYENWMLSKEKSLTTIGMYLRNVRTMYNEAKRNGVVTSDLYPFGRGKYQIPNGVNTKKALTHQQVSLIASYKVIKGTSEHRYRDYWLFSFLANGINIKDVANLKYKDIKNDTLSFVRAKTQRETKHNQRKITIVITPQIEKIIDRWGNTPKNNDQYIFPILEKGLTAEQEYNRISDTVHIINKYVKRIAKDLKIPENVTTYTARHSFATVLKRSGASTEFISESLGHSNISTTESYLGSFEKDEQRKWAEKVSNLINI